MPLTVRHAFVSNKPTVGGSDKVQGPHWDADHVITGTGMMPVGTVLDYAGIAIPTGWLECYGQILTAAAYPALFAALVKSAVVTISNATPAVVSWSGHGLKVGDDISFISTGVLPAPILDGDVQKYRVLSAGYSANSFRIALTWEGAAINTTTAGSGVITGIHAPYGASTGLSQFAVPDLRGMVSAGVTNMGGTQTSKIASGYQTGFEEGTETVAITVPNLPPHDHALTVIVQNRTNNPTAGAVNANVPVAVNGVTGAGSGTSTPIKVMQPTEFIRRIIYTGL